MRVLYTFAERNAILKLRLHLNRITTIWDLTHFGKIIRQRKEQHNIQKGVEAALGYGPSLSAWIGGDLADPNVDISLFPH